FYYAAASAEALQALGAPQNELVLLGLEKTQRADGSWVNANPLVKEDDPLIATAFAVKALAASLAPRRTPAAWTPLFSSLRWRGVEPELQH
ncbi:MAG: hypothetical protein ACRD2Y_03580, partial [Terriglobales bacterium]